MYTKAKDNRLSVYQHDTMEQCF